MIEKSFFWGEKVNNECKKIVSKLEYSKLECFEEKEPNLRDNSKIRSSHFVHDRILSNPLLGFSTCSQYKINGPQKGSIYFRAGKGSRTLDIDLGKVALYQLSYSRVGSLNLVKLGGL